MKNTRLAHSLKLLAACALLGSAASGFAATTWTPGAAASCDSGTSANGCGTATVTSDGVSVSATAFATTASGSTFASAKLYDYGSNNLGVVSGTETTGGVPDHAMDNNGATELISLQFGSSLVKLTSIGLGYISGDSDLSVLRFDASKGFTASITGKTIAQLLNTGWELVTNINNATQVDSKDSTKGLNTFNSAGLTSSWWLVSAFNSGYGGASNGADEFNSKTGLGTADYVKLLSVAGTVVPPSTSRIPEPGSLALMGAAFFAAVGARRRSAAKAQANALTA